jgi:hypothetical protein
VNADKNIVAKLRELLDRLADSRKLSNDEQEQIHDAVIAETRSLPCDCFLDSLDGAVGKSKSRRRESVYLLSEFTQLPEVIARLGEEFKNPDVSWRHWLVQIVGHRNLKQLASQLPPIIENDPDMLCRKAAIWSAGRLKADCCLPSLMKLAENPPDELRSAITWSLKDLAPTNAKEYFERIFLDASAEKQERIVAAWGLAKLGDKSSLGFLVEMMFDPDKRTPRSCTPGQSLRAAQAVCDIKGWQFQWNKTFVQTHRNEWRKLALAGLN